MSLNKITSSSTEILLSGQVDTSMLMARVELSQDPSTLLPNSLAVGLHLRPGGDYVHDIQPMIWPSPSSDKKSVSACLLIFTIAPGN